MSQTEFTQGLALLILHAGACNIQTDDKAIEALYKTTLGHLPGDLFVRSVKWVLARWKDTFRLPLPGHVLEAASAELAQRRGTMRASESYRSNEPEADVGPRLAGSEVEEIVRKAKQALAAATPSRRPA